MTNESLQGVAKATEPIGVWFTIPVQKSNANGTFFLNPKGQVNIFNDDFEKIVDVTFRELPRGLYYA